jgi:hypothetical protein
MTQTTTRAGIGTMHLLAHAHTCLLEASAAVRPADRYAAAHLAALRTAAAVLAARAGDDRTRRGPRNAWVLLARVAPELGEWADFFAAAARRRALAQSGAPGGISPREADDLLRDAEAFLCVATRMLGLPHHPPLPGVAAPLRTG